MRGEPRRGPGSPAAIKSPDFRRTHGLDPQDALPAVPFSIQSDRANVCTQEPYHSFGFDFSRLTRARPCRTWFRAALTSGTSGTRGACRTISGWHVSCCFFGPAGALPSPKELTIRALRAERNRVSPPAKEQRAIPQSTHATAPRTDAFRDVPSTTRNRPCDTKSHDRYDRSSLRRTQLVRPDYHPPPTEVRGPMALLPCDPATTFIVSPP